MNSKSESVDQIRRGRAAALLPAPYKGVMMLQAMLDAQEELAELLEVPFDELGLLGAAIGIVQEASEVLGELYVGRKSWDEVNSEKADKEVIDVLMYVLEYLVIRDYDANDIINMYYEKVEIVAERVRSGQARDKGGPS